MTRYLHLLFLLIFTVLNLPACEENQKQVAETPLVRLPLASTTDPYRDQNILLLDAPFPEPCRKERQFVEFCSPPVPLKMTRGRYQVLQSVWGQRKGPSAQLKKLIEVSPLHWWITFYPDRERPLVWMDPSRDFSIQLWPVEPSISQIQAHSTTLKPPGFSAESAESARIDFFPGKNTSLHKWILNWHGLSPQTTGLEIVLKPPQKPFRVLIDPGHGGAKDRGTLGGGFQEALLNLTAANELVSALSRIGIKAEMTHQADEEVILERRFEMVQSGVFDLVLSIHHDFFPEEPYERPACFYGRSDLYAFSQGLCKILTRHGGVSVAPSRRFLFLNQAIAAPVVLLELLNLNDPKQLSIVRDSKKHSAFLNVWAKETAQWVNKNLLHPE